MAPTEAFVRPSVIDPWPAGGIEVALAASPAECRALAERFGLVALTSFSGRARIDRSDGALFRVEASFEADVVQSCVVSLEDVPATLCEQFECRFARRSAGDEDALSDDEIEPLSGPQIDLGEVFAEQLGLALDPYPRAAQAYALVPRDLGPNITFGQEEPSRGSLAAAMAARE